MSFSKRCQTTEEKFFWYKWLLEHITLYQNKRGRSDIVVFEPVGAVFFSRIVTYVLTSDIDEVVKISFFKASYIVISGAQIAFYMCFNWFSIIFIILLEPQKKN